MRLAMELALTLSADAQGKQVRFSDGIVQVDTVSIEESVTRQEIFPIGTHSISLSGIAGVNFIYLISSEAIVLTVDGEELSLVANKPNLLFPDAVTTMSIELAVEATVTLVIGGN